MDILTAKKSATRAVRDTIVNAINQNNNFMVLNKRAIKDLSIDRKELKKAPKSIWKEILIDNTANLARFELAQKTRKINEKLLQRLMNKAIEEERKLFKK